MNSYFLCPTSLLSTGHSIPLRTQTFLVDSRANIVLSLRTYAWRIPGTLLHWYSQQLRHICSCREFSLGWKFEELVLLSEPELEEIGQLGTHQESSLYGH